MSLSSRVLSRPVNYKLEHHESFPDTVSLISDISFISMEDDEEADLCSDEENVDPNQIVRKSECTKNMKQNSMKMET